MNEIFNRINPADSIKPISNYSKEELNKYEWILKEFYSNKIIKQEKVMYNIVESYVETHNKLKAFDEEKLDLYPDNNDFILDSLSCEWGYILNLDNNTLEVWKGFQKYPDKKIDMEPKYNILHLMEQIIILVEWYILLNFLN